MPAVSKPQLPISGLGRAGSGAAGGVAEGSTTVGDGAAAAVVSEVDPEGEPEVVAAGLLEPQPASVATMIAN
ncbi:MAG TPA: hypothetical protein VFD36_18855, partial [Kofleriaceae bacterium]|nr:hypothetical protein [Kofleriaceae bacterium]